MGNFQNVKDDRVRQGLTEKRTHIVLIHEERVHNVFPTKNKKRFLAI